MHPVHQLPGLIASGIDIGAAGNELVGGYNTFDYTGAVVTRVVPEGMHTLTIDLWAGSGATMSPGSGFRDAGGGGAAYIVIRVQPGDVLDIYVGQGGGAGIEDVEGGAGGWPDGGDGGLGSSTGAGGGGGSSRVYLNGILIAIAGGGGGETGSSGTQGSGGDGGGAVPEIHSGTNDGVVTAASQTGPGLNTVDSHHSGSGNNGGVGWEAGAGSRFVPGVNGVGGGGAGGGYFGGAAAPGRGGGGGSGWVMPVGGDSNSALDREVLFSSTTTTNNNDGVGRQSFGWELWLGFGCEEGDPADGGDLFFSHNGRVNIMGWMPGGDAFMGRLPVPEETQHSSGRISQNSMCMRQFTAGADMIIDEVGFFTTNTTDSNTVGDTTHTVTGGGRVMVYNNAGVSNSPGSCVARTADITSLDEGENWFPLNQRVIVKQGEILWVGFNFADATLTQSLDRVAVASGEARRATGITVSVDPTPAELWGVSMTARTDAYPVAMRGEVTDDSYLADHAIAVVPFVNPTSTGAIDITSVDLGGRVPKGVVIFGGAARANTSNDAHINSSFGIASRAGEHQRCFSANLEDGQATSDGDSDQRNSGSIISLATPGETLAISPLQVAAISAWITNGVTINWSTTEATQRQFFAVFFAGDDIDCTAMLKTDWPAATTQIDRIGWTPMCAITGGEMSNAGNGNGSNTGFAFGLGMFVGNGDQGCISVRQSNTASDAGSPAGAASNTVFEHNISATASTIGATALAQGFDADGFEVVSGGLTSSDTLLFFVYSRGGLQASIIDTTTPTATGVQNVTGAGFQPTFALLYGHSQTAWNTNTHNSDDSSGYGYGAYDVNGDGIGIGCTNQDADPSVVKSSAHDDDFLIGRGASAETLRADFSGFTSDGFDLNWTAVHSSACRLLALCIGPA